MNVFIKKLHEDAVIPTRGSEKAAGYDLYACGLDHAALLFPHHTVMIGTGLAMEIPDGYYGLLCARSGLASKKGLRPANCVGIIDSDYRGEIKIALHNDSENAHQVFNGERIGQIVITPYLNVEFEEVEALADTQRGEGGFGSTGN